MKPYDKALVRLMTRRKRFFGPQFKAVAAETQSIPIDLDGPLSDKEVMFLDKVQPTPPAHGVIAATFYHSLTVRKDSHLILLLTFLLLLSIARVSCAGRTRSRTIPPTWIISTTA